MRSRRRQSVKRGASPPQRYLSSVQNFVESFGLLDRCVTLLIRQTGLTLVTILGSEAYSNRQNTERDLNFAMGRLRGKGL
ncbi:hypothetical protein D3C87_1167500 [compost metagenome]